MGDNSDSTLFVAYIGVSSVKKPHSNGGIINDANVRIQFKAFVNFFGLFKIWYRNKLVWNSSGNDGVGWTKPQK